MLKPYSIVGHKKFPVGAAHQVALMLRDPTERLLSHWTYFHPKQTLEAFLENPSYRHCMTKSLYGLSGDLGGCESNVTVTPAHVARATVHVRQLGFVGLVNQWETSVRLFHCAYMPKVPLRPVELLNVHASNRTYDRWRPQVPTDVFDERVYAEAGRRFDSDVRQRAACLDSAP